MDRAKVICHMMTAIDGFLGLSWRFKNNEYRI